MFNIEKEKLDFFIQEIEKAEILADPQIFEKYIKERVFSILKKKNQPPELIEYIKTDSIAEIIEKLIILTVRVWHLEDAAALYKDDMTKLGELKTKIDFCFKCKRPQLIQALNLTLNDAIINDKSLYEENVKLYK